MLLSTDTGVYALRRKVRRSLQTTQGSSLYFQPFWAPFKVTVGGGISMLIPTLALFSPDLDQAYPQFCQSYGRCKAGLALQTPEHEKCSISEHRGIQICISGILGLQANRDLAELVVACFHVYRAVRGYFWSRWRFKALADANIRS
jgi:hypothetical protein